MEARNEVMDSRDKQSRNVLRKASPWRQSYNERRPNPGRAITDDLPALDIDPDALNAYTEVDPLRRIWWRGVKKRKNNDARCFPMFKKYEGCRICLKVCPISRFGYRECMEAFKMDGKILGKGSSNGAS